MRRVNIHEAKGHLSRLVGRAAAGEPFIIAKSGKPIVKVTATDAPRKPALGFCGAKSRRPPISMKWGGWKSNGCFRAVDEAAARRRVSFMGCSRNDPRHFRATKMKIVLFLCTGNYYRSRFAEEMFNSSAPVECPGWRAISRGLAVDLGVNNVGPIAKSAVHALRSSGVDFNWKLARMPLQLETVDLETADHIVALKKAEHLPLLRERFHSWLGANEPDRVEYWHIDDVDQMVPARALPLILDELQVLKTRLSRDPVGDMKL